MTLVPAGSVSLLKRTVLGSRRAATPRTETVFLPLLRSKLRRSETRAKAPACAAAGQTPPYPAPPIT